MKKGEMEAHSQEYSAKMSVAHSAERTGIYRAAIEAARSAWEHIDGMMQYANRYEGQELTSISAIDIVLKYAPLALDAQSLNAVEELLGTCKRIERDTSDSVAEKLQHARARLWDYHRLWSYLQSQPDARQDELREKLGGYQEHWRGVAEAWEHMGLLKRTLSGSSYRLALCTRMGQVVPGKCPSCGRVTEAPKAMLLEPITCPQCGTEQMLVLLATSSSGLGE